MRSLFDNPKAMASVNLRRLPGGFHSVVKQASFNIAFWSNFGGFGKPKSMPKFDFRAIFSDVIFEQNFTSKFGSFLEAQNQKNSNFPLEKTMIFTKSVFSIKIQKTMNFPSIFGSRSEENSNKNWLKNVLFLNIAFSIFFLGFCLRFGSQKSLKNHKFSKKLRFEGLLWSSIAFKLLLEWILKPLEFDFHGF